MLYVEFLRARRTLAICAIIVAFLTAIVTYSLKTSHVSAGRTAAGGHASTVVRANSSRPPTDFAHSKVRIPVTVLVVEGGIIMLIMGVCLTASLNRQRDNLNLAWTKPVSKLRLALEFIVVDIAAMGAAFALAIVAGLVPIAAVGLLGRIDAGPEWPIVAGLVSGVAVMWYGLLQAATAWNRGSGQSAVVASCVVFIALLPLQLLWPGSFVHALVAFLNFLNPLAYLSILVSEAGRVSASGGLPLGLEGRVLASWALGLGACVIAMFTWQRVEA